MIELFVVLAMVPASWILLYLLGTFLAAGEERRYRHGRVHRRERPAPSVHPCPHVGCLGYEVNGLCTQLDRHPTPPVHPSPRGPFR